MSRQEMAAHRAETLQCLRVERQLSPWPYDSKYSDPSATAEKLRDEVRRASEMFGAAWRGRLKEFLDQTEGTTQ